MMNPPRLGERIFGKLLIPGYERGIKRRHTFSYWRKLERSQWRSLDALGEFQLARLQLTVRHAYENCPFYRAFWESEGIHPAQLRCLQDFTAWPTVDRDTIRLNRLAMRSQNPTSPLIGKATGGSSGVPLSFDIDMESYERRNAATYRGYGWAGASPGTTQVYLWGNAVGSIPVRKRIKDALYHCLHRRTVFSCFDLSNARILAFSTLLAQKRPTVIVAYTSALYEVARELEARGVLPYSPSSIIVGAEKLHAYQRTLIERVFRAPVFETYGSREFMLIGAECDRHEGLHLTYEQLVVEILNDDGKPALAGKEGNVTITDLTNRGMPFIRYQNGDRAVAGLGACSCGRGLPVVKSITGRQLDILTTPDGRRLPGEFFPHLLKDFTGIRRFQVEQSGPDQITLRIQPTGTWKHDDRQAVLSAVTDALGPSVHFDLEMVDAITLTSAGKLQVVINRCTAAGPNREDAHAIST